MHSFSRQSYQVYEIGDASSYYIIFFLFIRIVSLKGVLKT